MFFNSDDTPYIIPRKPEDSGVDISTLFPNGEYNITSCIPPEEHDVTELEIFCKKHNIIGLNIRRNPKVILSMLKNKMGIIEVPTKKDNKSLLKG
jgi:hypothetical protein